MGITHCEAYLEQKRNLSNKLFFLTEEILLKINADDLRELDGMMKKREQLIAEVDHLDIVYQNKCNLTEIKSSKLLGEIKEIGDLLQAVQKMDKEIVQKMNLLREMKLKNYNQAKQFRKVQSSYNNFSSNQGNLLDKQR